MQMDIIEGPFTLQAQAELYIFAKSSVKVMGAAPFPLYPSPLTLPPSPLITSYDTCLDIAFT